MATDTLPLFSATRNNSFYVYIYSDPRPTKKGQPIYVGKGTVQDDRPNFRAHWHWVYGAKNRFLKRVLAKIRKCGLEPRIEIVGWFSVEDDAFSLEIALIARIGRRDLGLGPLLNLTDGGEGMCGRIVGPSEREEKRISGELLWKNASSDLRERMSACRAVWKDELAAAQQVARMNAAKAIEMADEVRWANHVANAAAAKRTEEARADASAKQTDVRANETSEQKSSRNGKVKAARIADKENTGIRAKSSWARPGQKEKQGNAIADGQSSSWADPEKKAKRIAKLHATYAAKRAKKAAEEKLL